MASSCPTTPVRPTQTGIGIVSKQPSGALSKARVSFLRNPFKPSNPNAEHARHVGLREVGPAAPAAAASTPSPVSAASCHRLSCPGFPPFSIPSFLTPPLLVHSLRATRRLRASLVLAMNRFPAHPTAPRLIGAELWVYTCPLSPSHSPQHTRARTTHGRPSGSSRVCASVPASSPRRGL